MTWADADIATEGDEMSATVTVDSVAHATIDASYWGVDLWRKRIFLAAQRPIGTISGFWRRAEMAT